MAAAKYNERAEYLAKINILNGYLGQLVSTITLAAQNNIIHNFSTNMRDMKNRRDLLTPISFDDVIRIRAEIKDELAANLTNESFLRKLAAAGLIEIKC